ncbi:hypothetical protein NP233_g4208 [Leucocoprinus birnbaumii]|uniref:F-box domain-containing protein n=1 Tax=Leucocoprinus birnbaumii TaxID=56174 RepID=A0AAD5VV23_9AGAR|nr:hypothetical protein NP233_g4208 [Leucocoprinus birnbaumii]
MSSPPYLSKSLLRTSYIPSDCAVQAHKLLEQGSCRLGSVETEISRLRALISKLSSEKQETIKFIDNHREMLSPFNKLPRDLVEEVFYHCLPVAYNAVINIHEAPLLLGRVCTQWRRVSYTCPRLWTTIHIVGSDPDSSTNSRQDKAKLETISCWLARSGVSPLHISFYYNSPPSGWYNASAIDREILPELNVIASHSRRWRAIDLRFRRANQWIFDFLLRLHSSEVPLLRTFRLRVDLDTEYAEYKAPNIFLENNILDTPNLRCLGLSANAVIRPKVRIRWQNLTTIELTYRRVTFQPEVFAQLLAQCPILESCTISIDWSSEQWGTSLSQPQSSTLMITLPRLMSFSLRVHRRVEEVIPQLFDIISSPTLKHFALELGCSRQGYPVHVEWTLLHCLHRFLERSTGKLEEVDLQLYDPPGPLLLKILRGLPASIKRLKLLLWTRVDDPQSGPQYLDDALLKNFIPGGRSESQDENQDSELSALTESQVLFPNLEVIQLEEVDLSQKTIVDFLKSRSVLCGQNGVARLRRATILITDTKALNEDQILNMDLQWGSELEEIERQTNLQASVQYPVLRPTSPPVDSNPTGLEINRHQFFF